MKKDIYLRQLGLQYYQLTYDDMHHFIKKRTNETIDEIWLVEHYPIFTIGRSGNKKDLLFDTNIPIINSDRGGKITYHGPGQLIIYVLLDLKRNKITIKNLVNNLENIVIFTLDELGIYSYRKNKNPGVYVNEKKICSLGLRIHKGYSLHGLAVNINMDMNPFKAINPCGYTNIIMTQLIEFIPKIQVKYISYLLIKYFCKIFDFKIINVIN